MRVLVLWADDRSANLGVRALAEGSTAVVKRAWGEDCEVVLQDFRGLSSGVPITPSGLAMALVTGKGPVGRFFATFDVIFDTGAGDSFTDSYGRKRMLALMGAHWLSSRLGVPFVMGPQTVGPFASSHTARLARRSLRLSSLVSTRDSESHEVSVELGRDDAVLTTDVVFALDDSKDEEGADFDVLLNVSGLLWIENHHVNSSYYRESVRGTIDALLDEGRHVTLLPHVLKSSSSDSDVAVCEALAEEYDGRVAFLIPESLQGARAAIGSSNFLIGARMHAVLNAISQGVPAIPWAYSRKFAPLLGDLGIDWTIDLRRCSPQEVVHDTLAIIRMEQEGGMESAVERARVAASARIEEFCRLLRLVHDGARRDGDG